MMNILLLIGAGFLAGIILGITSTVLFTPFIGELVINTNEEKDIFKFEFSTPPEDIIENKRSKFCFLTISRK